MDGPKNFRCHDLTQPVGCEPGEQTVIEHHSAMDDAPQRRHRSAQALYQMRELGSIGHIKSLYHNVYPLALHHDHGLPRLVGGGATAAQQDKMTRPLGDQPFGNFQAKATRTASHQIRRIVTDLRARGGGGEHPHGLR